MSVTHELLVLRWVGTDLQEELALGLERLTTCRARATSWRALAEFAPSDEGLVERCSADLGFQTVSILKSYVMT